MIERDPGRQPERTRFAWRRTVLTVTIVTLLATRLATQSSATAPRLLVLAVVLAGWLAILVVSSRRIMVMVAARPAPARRSVPLTALATIGFAGVGIVLVIGW